MILEPIPERLIAAVKVFCFVFNNVSVWDWVYIVGLSAKLFYDIKCWFNPIAFVVLVNGDENVKIASFPLILFWRIFEFVDIWLLT